MGSFWLLDYSMSGFGNLLDCSHHILITVISCQIYNLGLSARLCVPKRICLLHIILFISYIHLFNFSNDSLNKIICIPVNKMSFYIFAASLRWPIKITKYCWKFWLFFGTISILLDIFPICWIDTFFTKVNYFCSIFFSVEL